MSLSVLKRKTNSKYSRISSSKYSKDGFSLNNPRRVGSHSNQVQIQTPMKGNVPRGHGSCCGHYPINIVKSRYNNYDPHVREFNGDKSNTGISVKTNRSSIYSRNKWINRPYPNSVTKQIEQITYEQYIDSKKGKTNNCQSSNNVSSDTNNNGCENNYVTNTTSCKKQQNISKRVDIKDQSEYLNTNLLTNKCLPPTGNKLPNPLPLTGRCNSGCNQ